MTMKLKLRWHGTRIGNLTRITLKLILMEEASLLMVAEVAEIVIMVVDHTNLHIQKENLQNLKSRVPQEIAPMEETNALLVTKVVIGQQIALLKCNESTNKYSVIIAERMVIGLLYVKKKRNHLKRAHASNAVKEVITQEIAQYLSNITKNE